MADDFRILTTGSELAGNGSPATINGSSNVNWWAVGICVTAAALIVVVAYYGGKNSIMPEIVAAKSEKDHVTKTMGSCPVYKKAISTTPVSRETSIPTQTVKV